MLKLFPSSKEEPILPLLPMLDFPLTSIISPSLEVAELENLLIYLSQIRRVDLRSYRRSTLMRRTQLRMQDIGVAHYQGYLDYLQQHPNEVTHLLDTIYINFTSFFRDPLVWVYLAEQAIPQMIANKAPTEPIRIWSAGCASGEETYSLAMLLLEILGIEQFQQRVWIYGTDVDADAILQARNGCYPAYKVEVIPAALREKYFERRNNSYCWRHNLHGSINFHVHDLIQTSPLPQIDLLVCRNLLIYFTVEAQFQALLTFHSSLQENGLLLLGNAETLITRLQRSLFTPLPEQSRMFAKVSEAHQISSLLSSRGAPMNVVDFNNFNEGSMQALRQA